MRPVSNIDDMPLLDGRVDSRNDPSLREPSMTFDIVPAGRVGRWHLPVGQSLSDICEVLNRRGVNYVALPAAVSESGELSALLVGDDHIPQIRDLITRSPLGQPLAVYSVTDLPGFTFQQHWRHLTDQTNMAVLPSRLAETLLARGVVEDGIRTLAAPDMLLWTIFRALYLSGNAHFAWDESGPGPRALNGPMTRIIADLANHAGVDISEPFELSALHQHLAKGGWEPPFDMLRRLSPWNRWAACKVRAWEAARPLEEPGMAVFFVRRAVFDNGLQEETCRIIESAGFEVLRSIDLESDQIDAAAGLARGGNWGPGAFHVSGGPPAQLLIAFDVLPAPVRTEHLFKYPHLDNAHILEAKLRCREFISARMPPRRRFNPVHSTDASADAWDVIRTFAPDDEEPLRETIKSRKAGFVTNYEVVRDLTRTGLRSKIELINYGGRVAVKKTFRNNCVRFLEREASFMEEISPHRPEIPPVLERGPNFLVMPFFEGRPLRRFVLGRGVPRLMTLRQVRQVASLLRFLFSRGYDPVDLGPHNLLVDPSGQLCAIDFEFVHRTGEPVDAELSACLSGIKAGYEGEWPAKALYSPKRAKCLDPWRQRWFACTGLSIHSFLFDPPAVQRVKRMVNYPAYLTTKVVKHHFMWLGHKAKRTLRGRAPAVTRIVTNAMRSRALGRKNHRARRTLALIAAWATVRSEGTLNISFNLTQPILG
jgi:hypothetical protein